MRSRALVGLLVTALVVVGLPAAASRRPARLAPPADRVTSIEDPGSRAPTLAGC